MFLLSYGFVRERCHFKDIGHALPHSYCIAGVLHKESMLHNAGRTESLAGTSWSNHDVVVGYLEPWTAGAYFLREVNFINRSLDTTKGLAFSSNRLFCKGEIEEFLCCTGEKRRVW